MAKVAIKSEKLTPFGVIFSIIAIRYDGTGPVDEEMNAVMDSYMKEGDGE